MIMNGLQAVGLAGHGQRYLGPPTRVGRGQRYLGPPIKIGALGTIYPTFREWLHGGANLPDLTEPMPDVLVDSNREPDDATGTTLPRAIKGSKGIVDSIMAFLTGGGRSTATGVAKKSNQLVTALVVAGGIGAAAYFLLGKKRRTA